MSAARFLVGAHAHQHRSLAPDQNRPGKINPGKSSNPWAKAATVLRVDSDGVARMGESRLILLPEGGPEGEREDDDEQQQSVFTSNLPNAQIS